MSIIEARQETPESRQFQKDEKNRQTHIKGAVKAFKNLVPALRSFADEAMTAFPDSDEMSLKRRGRHFVAAAKGNPNYLSFVDTWVGTEAMDSAAKSWRGRVLYEARDILLFKKPLKDALVTIEKIAAVGFQAITMAEAQAPLRNQIPDQLRNYLPENIVVKVDANGQIKSVTDRFENEHFTLGKKIERMQSLVRKYNTIVKQVKKDMRSPDEKTKLAALVTAIIMETGIRPGKAGNAATKTVNGEKVEVETFGAITLGPAHVRFVKANFTKLEFIGKKGSVNTASIADKDIIQILETYVARAQQSKSKYIFVTASGERFSYTDLQAYFKKHFDDISPTDFRKLRATDVVLSALRDEQEALYDRIRGFADTATDDLRERVIEAIVETFDAAIKRSQSALSHDNAATTVRSYINPTVLLRFLSQGAVDNTLRQAVVGGKTSLVFDPDVFVAKAMAGKKASGKTTLEDLLLSVQWSLAEGGVFV